MVDLKHEVQKRGFTVAHIKTDSIKIPDATPEIISFVMDFGKRYGYTFEHEATYDRMCLVNNAVYIARYDTVNSCMDKYGYVPDEVKKHPFAWTATGKQFAVPYIFKTLFSHEPTTVSDVCETFSVSSALYLDMNEQLPDVSEQEKTLARLLKDNNLSQEDLMDFKETGELPATCDNDTLAMDILDLLDQIAKGHDYHFVGRVGEFTPVKDGCGGGLLMREAGGKYSAATGSTGFRWLESEVLKELHMEDNVDYGFYQNQVDEAVRAISQYGDFEWFQSDDPYGVPPEG